MWNPPPRLANAAAAAERHRATQSSATQNASEEQRRAPRSPAVAGECAGAAANIAASCEHAAAIKSRRCERSPVAAASSRQCSPAAGARSPAASALVPVAAFAIRGGRTRRTPLAGAAHSCDAAAFDLRGGAFARRSCVRSPQLRVRPPWLRSPADGEFACSCGRTRR